MPDGTHTVGVTFFATADTASQPFANFSIPAVQTVKGVFNVMIQITDSKLFSRPLFMGVKVDDSGFIGQPSPVSAAPYSLYAMEAWHARQSGARRRSRSVRCAQLLRIRSRAASLRSHVNGSAQPRAERTTTLRRLMGSRTPSRSRKAGRARRLPAPHARISARQEAESTVISPHSPDSQQHFPYPKAARRQRMPRERESNLGLGNLATQGSNAVSISGGTIEGTAIGMIAPAFGSFTTLQYSGNVFTLGNETDNATGLNTVNISGSVPIAVVQTGTANGPITANVAGGLRTVALYCQSGNVQCDVCRDSDQHERCRAIS